MSEILNYSFSPKFKKEINKLPVIIQRKFNRRFLIWIKDPFNRTFKTEKCKNKPPFWKFSIDNDYRAVFTWDNDSYTSVTFHGIFTHNQLLSKGYY